MKNLKIEHTKISPSITADKDSGVIKIIGVSIPENSNKFYE